MISSVKAKEGKRIQCLEKDLPLSIRKRSWCFHFDLFRWSVAKMKMKLRIVRRTPWWDKARIERKKTLEKDEPIYKSSLPILPAASRRSWLLMVVKICYSVSWTKEDHTLLCLFRGSEREAKNEKNEWDFQWSFRTTSSQIERLLDSNHLLWPYELTAVVSHRATVVL